MATTEQTAGARDGEEAMKAFEGGWASVYVPAGLDEEAIRFAQHCYREGWRVGLRYMVRAAKRQLSERLKRDD